MDELEMLRGRFAAHQPGLQRAKRSCAVLCPLIRQPGGLHLLFEIRAAGIPQGGEACFPGGQVEPGESAVDCALRETAEELNIPPECVEILGLADFICNVRGFLLQPVLGLVSEDGLAALRPAPQEVSEVFTVPLRYFRETVPEIYRYELRPFMEENFPYEAVGISPDYPWSRGTVDVPVWHYRGHTVWGMTARMVRDLADRI